MTYYGQHEEDRIIRAVFDNEGKDSGFYVEVGAFDGDLFSNTKHFEDAGWMGICIEPDKTTFKKLQANRPSAICVNAACVAEPGMGDVTFYRESKVVLSGLAPDEEKVKRIYEGEGQQFKGFRKTTVPSTTLNEVLHEHLPEGGTVDFVTIDTEGTELDVMRGFDLGQWVPRLVMLEVETDPTPYDEYMSRMGYVKAKVVANNIIYVNQVEAADFLRRL